MSIFDVLSSSPVASAVGAIVAAPTASIIARWWQRQREADDNIKRWYQDALGLIGRLQQAGHRATSYQQADYPTLRDKLEPIAQDMQEHATSAPNGVAEDARIELVYLSALSTGLINLTEQADEVDPVEFFQNVQDHAREMYDGEYYMDDVNQLIDSFDVEPLLMTWIRT